MSKLEFRIENCTFGDPIETMLDKIRALTEEEIKRQTENLLAEGKIMREALQEISNDDPCPVRNIARKALDSVQVNQYD